jgi:hypothetical protein
MPGKYFNTVDFNHLFLDRARAKVQGRCWRGGWREVPGDNSTGVGGGLGKASKAIQNDKSERKGEVLPFSVLHRLDSLLWAIGPFGLLPPPPHHPLLMSHRLISISPSSWT